MPKVSTDDYLNAIQYAKDNGHQVNIDFSNLPEGVDPKAIASAVGQGLSSDHNDALNNAADNGHSANIDFSMFGDVAKNAATMAGETLTAGAHAASQNPDALNRSPIGQAALPIVGGVVGSAIGMPGVGAAIGEAATQGIDKAIYPDLAPKSGVESALKIGSQLVVPGAIEKGVEGIKTAYPYIAKLLTKLPMPVAKMFMDEPSLPSAYSGAESEVAKSVQAVQKGLETLHDNASKVYSETLDKLGLSGVKTADEAATALGEGEGKTISPKSIADKWMEYKTNPALSDHEKLSLLSDINQDINSHLKWAKAGQSVDPISSKLTPYLQTLKTGVKAELPNVPGGDALQKADDVWHSFRQLYNSLQPNLKDTGEATKWLTNVLSDAGTGSNTPKALLKALDTTLGQPVAETAQKQIASGILKRPMADTMMGKLTAVMALAHPSRAVTLPMVAAAQSPLAQTKLMQGLMMLQGLAHGAPEAIAPTVNAAQQGLKALSDSMPGDENDLVANQSR